MPPVSGPYVETQAVARKHDRPLKDKVQKAVWRGVLWTHRGLREPLMEITKHETWSDVQEMSWNSDDKDAVKLKMSAEEFCDYALPIHTEGGSYSSRLTYLLNCDSAPIIHELEWTAHFYHLLEPDVNHIHVHRNWTNLPEKME
ncbi:hypothetical protein EJ03DRAFT_350150 [Teratosphaeria nubilosa]|uniref:Glycosyl transferase CAP10 domain-containing protein n=1 Tax=Teratosphaeria nubilosa TaxID=161662 RepID=A0A6G1LD48_9PEZI|nr:hypothetical protein EJ03DRAFT_350150 [Teratosphaeria nubilosa]